MTGARPQAEQALAVPATPAEAVDGPLGFDPSRNEDEVIRFALQRKRDALSLERQTLLSGLKKNGEQITQCEAVASAFGVQMFDCANKPKHGLSAILIQLLEANPEGLTVKQLRPQAELDCGGTFHPKSIGVTLRRLSQKGVTAQRGRVWLLKTAIAQTPSGDPA